MLSERMEDFIWGRMAGWPATPFLDSKRLWVRLLAIPMLFPAIVVFIGCVFAIIGQVAVGCAEMIILGED